MLDHRTRSESDCVRSCVHNILTGLQLVSFVDCSGCSRFPITNVVDRLNDLGLTWNGVNRILRSALDNKHGAIKLVDTRHPHDCIGSPRRPEIFYLHHLDLRLGLPGSTLHSRYGLWAS